MKLEFKNFEEEQLYKLAAKKVKNIKGFYIHLVVYVLVNVFIFFVNHGFNFLNVRLFSFTTLSTPVLWGIFLACHGLSVFGPTLFLGKHWEERKIREFMEKEKRANQKWE